MSGCAGCPREPTARRPTAGRAGFRPQCSPGRSPMPRVDGHQPGGRRRASTWIATSRRRRTAPISAARPAPCRSPAPRDDATSTVSSRTASVSSRIDVPSSSTRRWSSSPVARVTVRAAASVAGWSIALTTMWPPRWALAAATPLTARLRDSVSPEVKITSPGSARPGPPPRRVPARSRRPARGPVMESLGVAEVTPTTAPSITHARVDCRGGGMVEVGARLCSTMAPDSRPRRKEPLGESPSASPSRTHRHRPARRVRRRQRRQRGGDHAARRPRRRPPHGDDDGDDLDRRGVRDHRVPRQGPAGTVGEAQLHEGRAGPESGTNYTIVIRTSCGTIRIALDPKAGGPSELRRIPRDAALLRPPHVRAWFRDSCCRRGPAGRRKRRAGLRSTARSQQGTSTARRRPMAKAGAEPGGTAGRSSSSSLRRPADARLRILGHATDAASLATMKRIDPSVSRGSSFDPPTKPVWIISAKLVPSA